MPIWSRLINIRYAIVDVEVGLKNHKIHDIGALRHDGATYHKASKKELFEFLSGTDYICGHNIIHHDAKYLFTDKTCQWILVDTLYISPLLFPERPYHKLLKDDKLISDQMNNPVNDCEKAKALLLDEIARWHSLPDAKRRLFASLLKDRKEFEGFLSMVGAVYANKGISELISNLYVNKICQHAELDMLIKQYPCELAYALALIDTIPIISMRKENGWVGVTYHQSKYMYQPLVEELLHQRGSGTSCVLTQTNEEAVILTALLRKHAINSKLIQSMDGFLFWNMAEMRYFLRYIEKRIKTPLIPEELWEKAKHVTYTTYEKSKSLTYVKRCIELFEQTNKVKYHSDFKEFVFESSVEDFCDISGTDVVVSTIHKAKGREFDNVYMLISDNYSKDDHLMRRYYVGMTRAKNQLFIHTNGNCFNHISADRHCIDRKEYAMPEEIVLQLSHKDVFLKFFKGRKQEILALRSGDSLIYKDSVLYTASTNKAVAKLSQNMQATMCEWEKKGYKVRAAYVRFIVAWKSKDSPKDEPETAVLLADLLLSL